MKIKRYLQLPVILICLACIGSIVGCGTKTQVVLLPEPDGRVGKVMVKSGGETALLDTAYDSAEVSGDGNPKKTGILDEKTVKKIFKTAIDIQPLPPVKHVLYFEFGTAVLTPESRAKIPEILKSIRNRVMVEISVSGHTDRMGSAQVNKGLAEVRALQMQKILIKAGVNPDRILTESHGEGNPLIPTADEVSEPRNGRAEVVIR